ncbi:hypothetical protein KIPB_006749 [Kipferlia bialata]|uniref:Uncharacterized protein n=1 Tax=Kipferlia bialata TaxID=797122 RepID=A0A9K3GJC4_9EUKA|nr:hypothetical protein KIPB_006749 [Kipferlia bialata]|eukprot:g6749.t1
MGRKVIAGCEVISLGMHQCAVLNQDRRDLTICHLLSDGTVEHDTVRIPGSGVCDLDDMVFSMAHVHGEIYLCRAKQINCLTLDTRQWRTVWRGPMRGQGRDGYHRLEVLGSCIYGYNHTREMYRFDTERPADGFTTIEVPFSSLDSDIYVKAIRAVHDELYVFVNETEAGGDEQYGYVRYREDVGFLPDIEWVPNGIEVEEMERGKAKAQQTADQWGGSSDAPYGMDYHGTSLNLQSSETVGRSIVLRYGDMEGQYEKRYQLDTISGEWQDIGVEPRLQALVGDICIEVYAL